MGATLFREILFLLTNDELKALCKEQKIRGYSSLNKAGIVDLIDTALGVQDKETWINSKGKKKLQEIIQDAIKVLNRDPTVIESLDTFMIEENGLVSATFRGPRWIVESRTTIESACKPDGFDCSCRAFASGARCIHYWAVMLNLLKQNKIDISCFGEIGEIVRADIMASQNVVLGDLVEESGQDIGDMTLEELLQSRTEGSRFESAMVELGLQKPRALKKKKTQDEVTNQDTGPVVTITFPVLEPGPPASIIAAFLRFDEGKMLSSSLKVMIDEKARILAHEGCMDFKMRMARKKLLCKHIIAVFLKLDQENLAKRLISKLNTFRFESELPEQMVEQKVPSEVLEETPAVVMKGQEDLKNDIIMFFINNGVAIPLPTLKEKFGDDVTNLLLIMVNEGMLVKTDEGDYQLK